MRPLEEMTREELIRFGAYWLSEYERVVRDHSNYLDRQQKLRDRLQEMTMADWITAAENYAADKL
jgi:hypothetical protein